MRLLCRGVNTYLPFKKKTFIFEQVEKNNLKKLSDTNTKLKTPTYGFDLLLNM
jgi:hypothetical protein